MPVDKTNLEVPLLRPSPDPQPHGRISAHAKSSFWQEVIAQVAAEAGIDPGLAVGVAKQESGLNPQAVNHSSGAVGIMQLMPGTAAALGVNPHDALGNVHGGVHYLREQLTHFGDEAKALAAYNWGPHRVVEAVERWGTDWLSHAPGETQRYVGSIMARAGVNRTCSLPTAGHSEAPSPRAVSSSSKTHANPRLEAEVANLRLVLDAYLLSDDDG
jgi:soluble lytic murein transglycosylase-like protein